MPEQESSGELTEGSVITALDVLRSSVQRQVEGEAQAVQLVEQATEIREGHKSEVDINWKQTKNAIQQVAGSGELTGKDLLLAVIDFRTMTPDPKRPQRAFAGQRGPVKPMYPLFDADAIFTKFDAITPGEPIFIDDKAGIIKAEPRTSVLDNLSALGAYVHIDVEFEPDEITEVKKTIGKDLESLLIGQSDIQAYIDRLNFWGNKDSHKEYQLLERLKRIKTQVSILEGFDLDTTQLEKEIAKGEYRRAHRYDHRPRRTAFQRNIRPRLR